MGEAALEGELVSSWIGQLALAVHYMHGRGVLHRDVTASNILLTAMGDVKLGDLGLSKKAPDRASTAPRLFASTFARLGRPNSCARALRGPPQVADNNRSAGSFAANTQCGTPASMSPEVVEGKPYNKASDVWGVGVVLFELLTLEHPFANVEGSLAALISTILNCRYDDAVLDACPHTDHLKFLAGRGGLLAPNAAKRLTLEQLIIACPVDSDSEGSICRDD